MGVSEFRSCFESVDSANVDLGQSLAILPPSCWMMDAPHVPWSCYPENTYLGQSIAIYPFPVGNVCLNGLRSVRVSR